jgi:opacity protein-like surface antigen
MTHNDSVRRHQPLGTFLLGRSHLQRLLATGLLMWGAVLASRAADAADFGIDALSVLPRGQLDENLGTGYGIGAQLLFPVRDGPFFVGGEISVARYAEERRPFFGDFDVVTSNDIGMFNVVLRAEATSGRVRPYLDAVVGLKVFQTESSLVDTCFLCEDEVLSSQTELEDAAFSYGVGAGLKFDLSQSRVFLDTQVRYTRGRDATYLTRGSISDDNLEDRLRESRTDAWSIHIGLSFRL